MGTYDDRDASAIFAEHEFSNAKEDMFKAGDIDGIAAGSWVTDGNTTDATFLALRDGLDNLDPAILDGLPSLTLGEWADDPTLSELIETHTSLTAEDLTPEEENELFEAYQDGWNTGLMCEVERQINAHFSA